MTVAIVVYKGLIPVVGRILTKKPKGKELITAEKQENRRISGIRIKVEHAIGGMKKCRIVKERFRCHKFGFEDMVILIACGLHNFRITHKMSHITI